MQAIQSDFQGHVEQYRRLATKCHLDGVKATHIRHRARQLLEQGPAAQEIAIMEKDTIRNDFMYIASLSERDQDVNREKIKPDCVAIALCVAAWSMLTWDTRWLYGLSNCKIVPARFDDGRSLLTFSPSCCLHVSVVFSFLVMERLRTYTQEIASAHAAHVKINLPIAHSYFSLLSWRSWLLPVQYLSTSWVEPCIFENRACSPNTFDLKRSFLTRSLK